MKSAISIFFVQKTIVTYFLPLIIVGLSFFIESKMLIVLLMTLWMVLWWVFEVLPLGVTALIPLFYIPSLGIDTVANICQQYGNPMIFLFLGGFIIARALEKTQLNERIALGILSVTGHSDQGIIIGFVIATTFLSMWISNTATTVMMVPIALSVIYFLRDNVSKESQLVVPTMATVMFLSIAYSANIGGIMTPIGTPPNVVFMGYLSELYSRSVDFWRWILVASPIAIVVLICNFYLLKILFPFHLPIPKDFKNFIRQRQKNLGPICKEQRVTIIVFIMVCFLWVFKDLIHYLIGSKFLNDTSIAIFAGFSLFFIPTDWRQQRPVLVIDDLFKIPWDIVLLFGGGMAMAYSLEKVGVLQAITAHFNSIESINSYLLVCILAALTLILTEIMSNVALCVVALPVIMSLGVARGLDPLIVGMPAAICASFAFSMPVSTPPNAIVFGTNTIRVSQMLKAGIPLNIISLIITMSLGWVLMNFIF